MKLEEMHTMADALRWALRRIDTAGLGCGEYFAKAEALLDAAPTAPTQVYCYWPDGSHKYLELDHWPQRAELPATAVRFDMAVPDPAVLAWAAGVHAKLNKLRAYDEAGTLARHEPPNVGGEPHA